MATLKPSDLFLMQREDLVLSFNGNDFAELVIEAGSEQFDYLTDRIDNLDQESNDFEIRITNNTNRIDLIIDAVNTLQKTSVTAKLNANPLALAPANDITYGHFYMTYDVNGVETDSYKFELSTKLYISVRDSQFEDPNAPIVNNFEWGNLEVHDPADAASGDYIQVYNYNTDGVGLYRILGITDVVVNGATKGYQIDVEFVKGNFDGSLVHEKNDNGTLRSDYLNSQLVVQGIKTKVGLDINDADFRYLVKKEGGDVEEDTYFWKALTAGQGVLDVTHNYNNTNPNITAPEQGDPIFQVFSTTDITAPTDENLRKVKFEVRSSGELYSDPGYTPWEDHHVPNVKYVKGNFLTETGANNTISANDRYLRRDGTNTMDSVIKFTNSANNDIIRLDSLPNSLAVINVGSNKLNIKVANNNSYEVNVGDSNGKVHINSGKVKLASNHVNYITSNYNNSSINNYVATIGVLKNAISNANLPTTGSGSTAGILKLSDSTSSTSDVNNGVAATPKAVKTVNDRIYNGMRVAGYGSSSAACQPGGFKEYNGGLYYKTV